MFIWFLLFAAVVWIAVFINIRAMRRAQRKSYELGYRHGWLDRNLELMPTSNDSLFRKHYSNLSKLFDKENNNT